MRLLLLIIGIVCLGAEAQNDDCRCGLNAVSPDAARSRACDSLGLPDVTLAGDACSSSHIECCELLQPMNRRMNCARSVICVNETDGFFCCNRIIRNSIVDRPIHRLGSSFPCVTDEPCTYALFSPGVPGMTPYRPDQSCRARVECGADRLIYYLMHMHDLSDDRTPGGLCRDFLEIEFMSFNRLVETCGDYDQFVEEVPFFSGIERDAIETHFHTNREEGNTFAGFYLYTICFKPDSEIPALESALPALESARGKECFVPEDPSGRKKRNADKFVEDIFEIMMERDSRVKRWGSRFRSRTIKVPDGATLSYKDRVIRVFIGKKKLYRFRGIRVLQTFNMIEGYLTHYGSADGTFLGCGYLRVGYGIAYFVQMPVNFDLYPTRAELSIITVYLNALFPAILEDNNSPDVPSVVRAPPVFPVEPQFFPGIPLLPDFPGYNGLPGFPSRAERGPGPTPQEFLDKAAVEKFVRACNPIVRQVVCDYLRTRKSIDISDLCTG